MKKDLKKLFDDYEGNLLNYFCGLSPSESKRFNKLIKNSKENNKKWKIIMDLSYLKAEA